jgi:UPF0716 family protein affecting phage T7 exclusion
MTPDIPLSTTLNNSFGRSKGKRRRHVKLPTIHQPILSLIAGILILIAPGLLSLIVAIYLIVIGVLSITRGPNRLFSI